MVISAVERISEEWREVDGASSGSKMKGIQERSY